MIRTFGIGPRSKNGVFGRLGKDLGPKSSANPRGNVKTMRWGKWPILDLFSVLGWSFRAQNGDHVLTFSPMFPVIFCIFSLRCDHDLSLFYCPYLFTFLIFYYKKAQHSTQHTQYTTTHAHTHAHLPQTVILRVV